MLYQKKKKKLVPQFPLWPHFLNYHRSVLILVSSVVCLLKRSNVSSKAPKPKACTGRMPFHSRFCRFTVHVHVRDLYITVPRQHTLERFWAWILTPIVNEKHSMTSKGLGFHPSFFRLWSLQSLVVCSKSGGCRAVKSYGNFIQLCDKLLLLLFKPCVLCSYVYNA